VCREDECTELRVGERRNGARVWRPPTGDETLSITARMMEDIAVAQAMQIIHGRKRGLERARYLLGYGHET
jgi:hypothetical protein